MVAGVALDFAVSTAIAGLGKTVKTILAVYNTGPQLQENRRLVAELERILAFLEPALQHILARAAQFASASLSILGECDASGSLLPLMLSNLPNPGLECQRMPVLHHTLRCIETWHAAFIAQSPSRTQESTGRSCPIVFGSPTDSSQRQVHCWIVCCSIRTPRLIVSMALAMSRTLPS